MIYNIYFLNTHLVFVSNIDKDLRNVAQLAERQLRFGKDTDLNPPGLLFF